jgi:hypothetical protein
MSTKKTKKKVWSKPKLTKIKVELDSIISASDMYY